jgi:hemerythrin
LAAVDPQAIVDFLVTWLVEHIQKTDQEFARLLAN